MRSRRMDELKRVSQVAIAAALVWTSMVLAQATPQTGNQSGTSSATSSAPAKQAPLQLRSLAPDAVADPFPPINPKFFTAKSPTAATVDSYLHAVLGYDSNRIWRVVAIQTTPAAGVSRVTALVSEKTPNAKVQQAAFFVLDDGKHLIADTSGVLPFGADPYAENRALLQARADGPARGAASKDLMLVEFADLQCPHCKDAAPTMKRLAEDFPKARIVWENYPLVDLHPFAEKAALDGVCVAKKSNEAFFAYADAVYATQDKLTADEGEETLKNAIVKAGADPAAVAECARLPETKHAVDASLKLGQEVGVDQTPMLMINGRLLPLGGIPYETLKQIVIFQAGLDGVSSAAATAPLVGPSPK